MNESAQQVGWDWNNDRSIHVSEKRIAWQSKEKKSESVLSSLGLMVMSLVFLFGIIFSGDIKRAGN